jgi:S-DNA-T family DNA segregation ATPase FtsK/SpoIIIE
MVMFGSGDQFPETVPALIVRWAWRYRSELAPLSFAFVTAIVGLVLHATHPGWWPLVLGCAIATAGVLATVGQKLGLTTFLERVYATSVAVAAGGWLAAATTIGPAASPLPFILGTGAVALGVPWWTHGRRRARVRVERKLAVWPVIAEAVGLAGSRVMDAVVDVWGWRARFGLARGQTIDDVRAKLPAIESGLGTFRGAARVYPTADNLANRFELRVLDSDPHADAIPWPGPSVTSIAEPIELGPFEDAMPARVLLLRRHGLIGGVVGSGKSGGINVLMGNLSACRDVVIWAIDLKKGMELQPWAPCIDRLATTPAQARALLRDAAAVLEARAEMLATAGRRVWEPTSELPVLIIVIDEYAELVSGVPDAIGDTDSIARLGRAVAVTLVAATQRPTQKAMGAGAVRSQMDIRICFRVRERKDVDLILGQGMLTSGWHAHTLNAPGKFLLSAPEHDIPRRARAYLLTDEMVSATASRHAEIQPCLDEVSRQAIGAAHAGKTEEPSQEPSGSPDGQPESNPQDYAGSAAETILRAALSRASEEGVSVSVASLVTETGMSRRWVYYRLHALADAGRAVQTARGQWHALPTDDDTR